MVICLATLLLLALSQGAEPSRIVQAEEILQKIELGKPVEYDKVIVAGDLNISGLELPRVAARKSSDEMDQPSSAEETWLVASPISITNSVIRGSVSFKGIVAEDNLSFRNTKFEGTVTSTETQFNMIADFLRAQFNQSADFSLSRFNQSADFRFSRFDRPAYFKGSNFNQLAQFRGSRFNQVADFGFSQFNRSADFTGSEFNQSASFGDSQFGQSANFRGSRFNQAADFSYSLFGQSANFGDSQFGQSANFRGSKFNQLVDFSYSQFDKSADFSDSQFRQESFFRNVLFGNADFGSATFFADAFFEDSKIKGALNLAGTTFGKLKIRWSSINDLEFDDTAYYLLIENFKKVGLIDDANKCFYTYRSKHGQQLWDQKDYAYWFFDSMAWLTYGYGLQPWQPLGWSILFIILAALFFWWSGSIRRKEEDSRRLSFWNSLLLGATYFTSGASNIISATPEEFAPQGAAKYVIVLLRLLGWVFFVLFLSSLGRIV